MKISAIVLAAATVMYAGHAVAQQRVTIDGFDVLENGRLIANDPDYEVEVVDGDTLWLGIHQIRLFGVDALEPKQPCMKVGKSKSYCHQSASDELKHYSRQEGFRCEIHVRNALGKPWINYGRYVATCYVNDVEVNAELVRNGWVYPANTSYGDPYRGIAAEAKAAGRGIYSTEHVPPWEWRKAERGDRCTCD